jgi:hypothetical protein
MLAIVVSLLFLGAVLELVRRRRLVEEYSFLWIACALVMLAVSIWRELLHAAARELGVHDPPNVLLIVLTGVVVVTLLGVSVILSRQRRQIDRLIEETAILAAEVRELRTRESAKAAQDSGPDRPRM